LRTRAEHAAAVDTTSGRSDWVTGHFSDRTGNFRRAGGYRFNCAMDYNSGQVNTIEILRADGTALQSGSTFGTSGSPNNQSAYDQNRIFRACQHAVVARHDGYQNVSFRFTTLDSSRSGWGIRHFQCIPGPGDRYFWLRLLDRRSATPPDGAPPLFIAVAADDQTVGYQGSIDLFTAWSKANVPVELHVFQTGRHGFGKKGGGADHFMDRVDEWMKLNGWLSK